MLKILLTNDDGIYAPGLAALYRELNAKFDLTVVAPESEMSAVGHAITIASPLRVREVNKNGSFFGYGVSGTPADCVKIAVQELLKSPPDIILSGINLGANVGVNVLYSGTVSAATEGAFLGIRSAAISLDTLKDPDFQLAASFAVEIIRYIEKNRYRPDIALNVNVPAVSAEKIKGIVITRQGMSRFRESFKRRVDPRGNVYYWLAGEEHFNESQADTDISALKNNMISITPISYDLTSREGLERLKSLPLPEWSAPDQV